VRVELALLVCRIVVVRVTNRRQRTDDHAPQTKLHSAKDTRHFVDHLLSWMTEPLPTWVVTNQCRSNFTVRTRPERERDRKRPPTINYGLIYCPQFSVSGPKGRGR